MSDIFPMFQGTARIPSAKNIVFGNLEPLVDSNLVDARPDFYDGARPIREELGSYITPTTQEQAPVLPNFFTEAKGPDNTRGIPGLRLGPRIYLVSLFDKSLALIKGAYWRNRLS